MVVKIKSEIPIGTEEVVFSNSYFCKNLTFHISQVLYYNYCEL